MDKSQKIEWENVKVILENRADPPLEIRVTEVSGCSFGDRISRLGASEGNWLINARSGWIIYAVSGSIPTETVGLMRNVRPWFDKTGRVTFTMQLNGQEPLTDALEKPKLTFLFPEGVDVEVPQTKVAIFILGFKLCVDQTPVVQLAKAFCMICESDTNPGRSIRGAKGDIVVMCDTCRKGLAEL